MSSGTSSFSSISVVGTGNNETRGAIRIGGATTVLSGNISLLGSATFGMETAGTTISGNITSATSGTQTLSVGTSNNAGAGTLSGNIGGGTGTIALTKVNSGVLTLTGTNTYTGNDHHRRRCHPGE